MGTNRHGRRDVVEVQDFLSRTYGGPMRNYPYHKCAANTWLIRIPAELDKNEVINAGIVWGAEWDWWFSHRDNDAGSFTQATLFRVRIKITNFPLQFWHPSFIQHVVSEFGEIDYIDDANVTGTDRTCLNIWVNCIDPWRIPISTVIPYGNRWTECYIHVEGWHYSGWIPPKSRLAPTGYQGNLLQHGSDQQGPRYSLLAAHDRLQGYQRQEPHSAPLLSSPSETTIYRVHDAPAKITPSWHGLQETGAAIKKEKASNHKAQHAGQMYCKGQGDKAKNRVWSAFSPPKEKATVKEGDFSNGDEDWLCKALLPLTEVCCEGRLHK